MLCDDVRADCVFITDMIGRFKNVNFSRKYRGLGHLTATCKVALLISCTVTTFFFGKTNTRTVAVKKQ
jgi:hypothetical protein